MNRALDVVTLTGEEYDALRTEVGRLQELCNGLHRSLTDSQAGFVHHRDRAERLVEALRYAETFIDTFARHPRHGRDEAVNEVLPVIRAAMNNG